MKNPLSYTVPPEERDCQSCRYYDPELGICFQSGETISEADADEVTCPCWDVWCDD